MNFLYSRVLVHGNFEILHTGHVRLFAYAKSMASKLIVGLCVEGLNVEETARRRLILEVNPLVDQVIEFVDISKLIEKVKPDALIKGREFADQENIEEKLLAKIGGRVIFSSGDIDISQSTFVPKISSKVTFLRESVLGYLNRNGITIAKLRESLSRIRQLKVLVVGDVILDEYIECVPVGLSQETPSIVARPVREERFLGGAGIIAAHCAGLGASSSLLAIIGDDKEAETVKQLCQKFKVNVNWIVDTAHPTVLKQRFMSGRQVMFRLNRFRQEGVSKEIVSEIRKNFVELVNRHDIVIFADFSYGVLNESNSQELVRLAKEKQVFTSADSQTSSQTGNLSKFSSVDLLTPTEREARQEIRNQEGLVVLSHKLMEKLKSKMIILKLGPDGILIAGQGLHSDHIPALNEEPIDVAGAGDSLLASATLALASGADIYTSGLLGNIAAAIQISRVGNLPVTSEDILEYVNQLE